jgi:hypothetical protein
MGTRIGFVPSDGNYRINQALTLADGTKTYTFDVRWNTRANAWYFDMYDPDGIIMVAGVKVVLNTPLGRRSAHPFFSNNAIIAIDSAVPRRDPGFDDISERVEIWHLTATDIVALRLVL